MWRCDRVWVCASKSWHWQNKTQCVAFYDEMHHYWLYYWTHSHATHKKKGFQRRSWYSKKKKKNSFDRYRNQWQWAFCAYTSEIMMVSVLSLRFAVASWWSPTPGRATRGNTSALERTWWGRGRARSLNSLCSVKHFFAALWLHFYNFAVLHLV